MLSQKVSLEELKSRYAGKDWVQERIDKLIYDLNSIKDMPPFAAVNYIRYAVGYDRFLMEYARDRRLKEEDLLEWHLSFRIAQRIIKLLRNGLTISVITEKSFCSKAAAGKGDWRRGRSFHHAQRQRPGIRPGVSD